MDAIDEKRVREALHQAEAELKGELERRFDGLARELLGEKGAPASGIRKVLLFAPDYVVAKDMARMAGLSPHQVIYVHNEMQLRGLDGNQFRYLQWGDRYSIPWDLAIILDQRRIKMISPDELRDLTKRNGETT